MKHLWGKTLKWFRTFHIYLTLIALVLLVFFSVSGFLMNHSEWFEGGAPKVTRESGTLPASVLAGDRLAVVEYLRAQHRAKGEVTDYQASEEEISVQFRSPGRQTDARITRAGGSVEVTHEAHGLYDLLADLHRGKNAGVLWKLAIDATALLVIGGTLTGFVMWMGMRTRRRTGLIALVASVLATGAAYLLAVW